MSMHGVPQGVAKLPPQVYDVPAESEHPEKGPSHHAPGTLVLVFVFLAAFIVYYFVNWKLLSFIWKIG